MKVVKILAIVAAGLMLIQCDQLPGSRAAKGPSPYAFDMTLDVTPQAAALMKANGTHFVAAALYFGRPKKEALDTSHAMINRVRLGYETVGLPEGATRVHLPAAAIDTRLLGDINGEPHVMVSIYSAKKDNIRDEVVRCKTYFGIVSSARAHSPTVACDLIRP